MTSQKGTRKLMWLYSRVLCVLASLGQWPSRWFTAVCIDGSALSHSFRNTAAIAPENTTLRISSPVGRRLSSALRQVDILCQR